ncbi:hypothetical protein A2165_00545 [Candidatus Curtissbacteria bacterium RBG_13_40_7]|uniref:Uncharacterized protein n=1 Tax=Candidatus Curtissbacteria bacterium RBG_13_40_7 TaxID=1797706 RepID=A0A1F5FTW6_9BACT|nr:MAG: hypothetical protein A2165_00545 [Candidatus Curtissbacteria bacterium RBG_13_40_7]
MRERGNEAGFWYLDSGIRFLLIIILFPIFYFLLLAFYFVYFDPFIPYLFNKGFFRFSLS